MHAQIKKRDGRLVKFNAEKITNAIAKAGAATGEFDPSMSRMLTIRVLNLAEKVFDDRIVNVEEIQDIVEEVLLSSPYRKTAKAYIIYRDQHARLREIANRMEVDLVDRYLKKMDWKINENSNMDYSLQGLNNYISSEVSKVYWLNEIYSPEIRKAHTDGDFHIHDLSLLSVYCVGWDLYDLLMKDSGASPERWRVNLPDIFAVHWGKWLIFSIPSRERLPVLRLSLNFDTLLAPFIRYDNLTFQEIHQALQEFIFNINVPTRVGFQTPFTNVTLDIKVPSYYADRNVIIGGEPRQETYGEFQEEMNLFNKAFLQVMAEGDAKGRVFTFPIPTYSVTKNFDWDDPKLEGLWDMTAKYGVPYFSNFINSDMNPEDARSMCCRLRIDNRELQMRGGGLFGSNPLTGSIGVITINMPRIGYLADTEDAFLERLDKLMVTAKESLEIKRKVLEKFTDGNLYPYTRYYLRSVKERFGEYWKNHFSTIGLVGMNEACLNLLGRNIAAPEGQRFVKKVLNFMRERLILFQKETGNNYNLESTPAEGTSYRLAKADKEKYADIICANEEDYQQSKAEPFYTNSTQLPVNFTDDVFDALDLQDDIQTKYTGGTVFHTYAGERISDSRAVKTLIRKICENYRLPYITFTPTFSVCPSHGYLQGEITTCPTCQEACEVYSRVVGYLRPVKQWNMGKKEEFKMRKVYHF